MTELQSTSAEQIIKQLADAGKVDTAAVEQLQKRLEADWVISQDEAEMLFQINRQVGDHPTNCPTWSDLYVDAISRFVVFDMNTPGEVSEEEAAWLLQHLTSSTDLSHSDARLLNRIRSHASQCCESLEPLFTQAAALQNESDA